MITKILKKVPAGYMLVPLFLASFIHTFFPEVLTTNLYIDNSFGHAGIDAIFGMMYVCMGAMLDLRKMVQVIRRGGVLLCAKVGIGMIIGLSVGAIFGMDGIFGISAFALICAVTNSNGGLYLSLMIDVGDEVDQVSESILGLNDGPFFTLIALGASGLASISFSDTIAVLIPLLVGMLIGNLDKELGEFLAKGESFLLFFMGAALGANINLMGVFQSGITGILLGVITVSSGAFICLIDRIVNKRPGYAGWACASTAGNAVGVPAIVAQIQPSLAPYVATVTAQVAASCILTAILVPIVTSWWVKKHGSPNYPLKAVNMVDVSNGKISDSI